MEVWLDAQLSPLLAKWITDEFDVSCKAVRDLGLRDATDATIFSEAKKAGDIVVVSKDLDFCDLLVRFGAPPKIIWLTVGNCSNAQLQQYLLKDFKRALLVLEENDLVEIGK